MENVLLMPDFLFSVRVGGRSVRSTSRWLTYRQDMIRVPLRLFPLATAPPRRRDIRDSSSSSFNDSRADQNPAYQDGQVSEHVSLFKRWWHLLIL